MAAARLNGKTIVITGASSGIGRSTAFEFARVAGPASQIRLVLTARRLNVLQDVAADLVKQFGDTVKVLPVALDVSDPDAVRGFVPSLPEEFRDINVLVNNAGLAKGFARAPGIAEADMNTMFATNVTGLINLTQAVLPIYQARPDGGHGDIINIGSNAGRYPYVGGGIYCATKAAIRSFSESLRQELVATRIRVIEIDPGQVETNFAVVRHYGDQAKADAIYANVDPLEPEDIAEVIVFAASRRENVVLADALIYPSHQAGYGVMHRK
ncbi:nadp-dependent l-serine l-allo-threonine dehydrogenase ydfg [Ophiostoma piceae UAMH 11346]|uniref:Nadp-dependent l-serine l-allo-threonine dehydrogenase ydfg n=1 Tax=Ophiostoma piceae (strain UAMH 11346) TaxID=1262450 RepID=S3C7X8_OPHP1|nr:nadp-dependent l-serine l-allo-threonine dehydrogenase ydfg [Ophiostoma piceae UAMH 11346]